MGCFVFCVVVSAAVLVPCVWACPFVALWGRVSLRGSLSPLTLVRPVNCTVGYAAAHSPPMQCTQKSRFTQA